VWPLNGTLPMRARLEYLVALLGHGRARNLLVVCGLIVGSVLAAGTGLLALQLRAAAIADSERELKNLALVLSEEIDRGFQALDLVEVGLIEYMRDAGIATPDGFERRMTSLEMHLNLRQRIVGLPHIDGLTLFSNKGELLNMSHTWPAPVLDASDRDYYKVLAAEHAPDSYIGAPIVTRARGVVAIILARKFIAPDGQFIGVVAGAVQAAYLEAFLARISVGDGGSFSLFRRDGLLLARYPHFAAGTGNAFGRTRTFQNSLAALDHGVTRDVSIFDGKDRLIAPHSLPHYPLIITATTTVEAALSGWHQQVRWLVGFASLMELVIGAIVLLAVRQLRGDELIGDANAAAHEAETARVLAEAELALSQQREQAGLQLQSQSVRFETALANMVQGLIMVDHAGNLLVVNRRFCELAGLPAGAVMPGISYAEMLERVLTIGNVKPDELAELRRRRDELIGQNKRSTFMWQRTDGRTYNVTHQPMEEGWLTTYEDITERRTAEARIAHLARHDALTNLPNRVLFRETLEHSLAFARRGHLLALHCLDLDQFKAVNDTLGHPIGDGLLQAVAQRLRDGLRETDMIARLGGDEFAVVQSAIGSPIEATWLASRLIELLEAPFEIEGHRIVIGTSIGIVFAPQDGSDADQLLKNADLALYRAKVDGRGVYRLFQAEMDAAMQARRLLELDLRQALSAGQFEVFYQPLIDVRAHKVAGCEALLRWRHPTKGLVPPDQFIHLAEETGLIVPIGEWVLRQACITASQWRDGEKVAVNLSPVQFKSRNLVAAIIAALTESGLHPRRLELEITETVMLQDTDATLATLHQLRDLGISIAMDDFGTGYSSLSYLRRFPFGRIKIDQSFVRDLGKQADCIAIVRAVTALGSDLGMAITAEGVETRQQFDTLALAGCTEIQGYLFSPAVPDVAIPDLFRTIAASLRAASVDAELEHIGAA
jgi:diguanylate cyclase (GGDEF)-like protein/PAS domain S-box-containing protein